MKQPLPSWAATTLAFFALCVLIVGVLFVGNAPAKADRVAMGRCADVCTESSSCALVCNDPNYSEPITCGQYGTCAVPTPTPTPTPTPPPPTPDPNACSTVCTTSTSCDAACNIAPNTSSTCGAYGVCAPSSCNATTCPTRCCAAGCAAKPTFSVTKTDVLENEEIAFAMTSANTDPNDNAWNFGDGQSAYNRGSVVHSYAHAGDYAAVLVAGDLVCGTWQGGDATLIHVRQSTGGGGTDDCPNPDDSNCTPPPFTNPSPQ